MSWAYEKPTVQLKIPLNNKGDLFIVVKVSVKPGRHFGWADYRISYIINTIMKTWMRTRLWNIFIHENRIITQETYTYTRAHIMKGFVIKRRYFDIIYIYIYIYIYMDSQDSLIDLEVWWPNHLVKFKLS